MPEGSMKTPLGSPSVRAWEGCAEGVTPNGARETLTFLSSIGPVGQGCRMGCQLLVDFKQNRTVTTCLVVSKGVPPCRVDDRRSRAEKGIMPGVDAVPLQADMDASAEIELVRLLPPDGQPRSWFKMRCA